MSCHALAAFSPETPLKPLDIDRRPLLPKDVQFDILYCGICHSDIHVADNDWKNTTYPVVPGHEILGKVTKVGKDVTKFKVGDYVGVGCIVNSCMECKMCKAGYEMFCANHFTLSFNADDLEFPGHKTNGGFSEKYVCNEHFVLSIPKALQAPEKLPGVASILCGGITAYSPLRQFDVKKGTKVGVLGLGGIGNIGATLAIALGAEVTFVSRSHSKDAAAKEIGAKGLIASSSAEEMAEAAGQFDFILDTIPFDHDLNLYVPLLAPFGTLCVIGQLAPFSVPLNAVPLIFGNRRIAFSAIGGIEETQELLDLCAEKDITAEHDVIKVSEVNEVWRKISNGETSRRFVIDTTTF